MRDGFCFVLIHQDFSTHYNPILDAMSIASFVLRWICMKFMYCIGTGFFATIRSLKIKFKISTLLVCVTFLLSVLQRLEKINDSYFIKSSIKPLTLPSYFIRERSITRWRFFGCPRPPLEGSIWYLNAPLGEGGSLGLPKSSWLRLTRLWTLLIILGFLFLNWNRRKDKMKHIFEGY